MNQRGGPFLRGIGFQGWKLQCQATVSAVCTRPEGVPASNRTKCPGCHEQHMDLGVCLRKTGLVRKNKVNSRLALIIQTLKRRNRPDLIGKWSERVCSEEEWKKLPDFLNNRDRGSVQSR